MSARKKKKTVVKDGVPKFRTEDEERDFWAEHDVVDFFDWDRSVQVSFPALKPLTQESSRSRPRSEGD